MYLIHYLTQDLTPSFKLLYFFRSLNFLFVHHYIEGICVCFILGIDMGPAKMVSKYVKNMSKIFEHISGQDEGRRERFMLLAVRMNALMTIFEGAYFI